MREARKITTQKKSKRGREEGKNREKREVATKTSILGAHTERARKEKEEEEEKFYAQHAQIEVEGAAVQKNRNIHTRTHST